MDATEEVGRLGGLRWSSEETITLCVVPSDFVYILIFRIEIIDIIGNRGFVAALKVGQGVGRSIVFITLKMEVIALDS